MPWRYPCAWLPVVTDREPGLPLFQPLTPCPSDPFSTAARATAAVELRGQFTGPQRPSTPSPAGHKLGPEGVGRLGPKVPVVPVGAEGPMGLRGRKALRVIRVVHLDPKVDGTDWAARSTRPARRSDADRFEQRPLNTLSQCSNISNGVSTLDTPLRRSRCRRTAQQAQRADQCAEAVRRPAVTMQSKS